MTGTERPSSLRRTGGLSLDVSKLNGAALGLGTITEGHEVKGPPAGNPANELATCLRISLDAINEAMGRGLLSFLRHRNALCWRGDACNGCLRRLDGQSFKINGECVKAKAETRGESWHRLIGLDDVIQNNRREILLVPEGSKDALAALHFADAEGRLSDVGVVVALGSAVKVHPDDVEALCGRRIRIFPDVDATGLGAAERIGQSIATVAAEAQIFDLTDLDRDDGTPVKDLFDLTRISYDAFEANRDLWAITDLDSKGKRVRFVTEEREFFPSSPLPLRHESRGSRGFPVYPVSNCQELEKGLEELAVRNACVERETTQVKHWQLARDLAAIQKRIGRKLNPDELMRTFNKWYSISRSYLDVKKTREHYCATFLAKIGKVRVPTGEGEALKKALESVSAFSVVELPELPGMPSAPESWRKLIALHRELARQSSNGTYFLSCRDASKVHPDLNKDSANNITRALEQLGVISFVRVGDSRPGGKASEFRYLLRFEK